jgi:hypothetical protein
MVEEKNMGEPDLAELSRNQNCLQKQISTLLIFLFVVSGTLNLYLFRQWRTTSGDVKVTHQQLDVWNKELAVMKGFATRLVEFSKTHPDFAATLAKYGINANAAPAPAPAPKK